MTAPSIDAVSGLVEELRAAILRATADEVNGQPNGDIIVKGCEAAEYCDPEDAAAAFVDSIIDEVKPFLEAQARELASLRNHHQEALSRIAALEDAVRVKDEAHLSGLASDIAREIEAHDLFDCPEGTTYVRAANAIADRLVERFGRTGEPHDR